MPVMSLQQQLRRQWLLTLLLLMLPLLWLADYGVRQLTTHTVLSRLQHDADSLTAALAQTPEGQWQVDSNRLGTLYNRVYSGHYFVIRDQQGTDLRSRSLWDKEVAVTLVSPGQEGSWQQPGIRRDQSGEQWLVLTRGVRISDHDLTLWLAEDIAPLRTELNHYRRMALLLLTLSIGLLALIQRQQLRAAFQRLHPLQQQLRALRFGERDSLGSAGSQYPQEVQPLAEEIDRLLTILQQRVSRSRNALGNLAHEMKQPLQRLQLLSEQLSTEQQQQQQEVLHRLQALIQRELKRARIVGVSSPGRQTRLAEDLPPLLTVLRQLYPQASIQADYEPTATLPQDRDDMLELLGNLLDNACQYAAGEIRLQIRQKPAAWQINVCDQGPGIAAEQQQRLLQRGVRMDEAGPAGSGLGLAIVSDIVESYHGSLQLQNNQPRGLCVCITLPLPDGQ